jgi:hypothetical protein
MEGCVFLHKCFVVVVVVLNTKKLLGYSFLINDFIFITKCSPPVKLRTSKFR